MNLFYPISSNVRFIDFKIHHFTYNKKRKLAISYDTLSLLRLYPACIQLLEM